MKDEKRKEDRPKSTPPPAMDAKHAHSDTEKAPKPKYTFKIVPADPKNTLDFEDTADK
jgi:hypothetical protein